MVYKFKLKIDKVGQKVEDALKEAMLKRLDAALNDIADFIATEADNILRYGNEGWDEGTFDTGFLAGSQVVDKERFLYKEVGYSALYAPYIEYGTRPHHPPIKPIYDWLNRKKKDLNIKIKSKQTVTLRDGNTYNIDLLKVTMSIIKNMEKIGTEEHPFLRPAYNLGTSKAGEFITKNMKKEKSNTYMYLCITAITAPIPEINIAKNLVYPLV